MSAVFNAVADHPTIAFGIDGAGPIRTISAITLPSGTLAFGIQTEIIDNDEFSTRQLESLTLSVRFRPIADTWDFLKKPQYELQSADK